MYNHNLIEKKWQEYWEKNYTNKFDINSSKPKFYVLDMFPYPSGSGLHVGHVLGYTATDIVSRYKKYKGFNVLHPIGWDSFGLPAEQFAIKNNKHPAEFTYHNIENFIKQLKKIGFDYDYAREVNTCDPKYYHWTQWIFNKLYENGLAEYKDIDVNWCEGLGTVLANDEIIEKDGVMVSERGGYPVVKKPMKQWMLKITKYADRLIDDLDTIAWSDKFKVMQKNWIGRSFGAKISFSFKDNINLEVFTTRPDTLYGVTYLAIAPENKLTNKIIDKSCKKECAEYIKLTKSKSELQRLENSKDKTGVFSGSYVINPINNKKIPIYLADYVLNNYGTGVVMGCPGHDERDFEFAKKFKLPIEFIIKCKDHTKAFTEDGIHIKSKIIDGLNIENGIKKMIKYLEEHKIGKEFKTYKFRDWLFSRQRYWGEPIPVLFDKNNNIKLDWNLPLVLPNLKDFTPIGDGSAPLNKLYEWVNININNKQYRRETNTMPGSAGSSWYFLAYLLKNPDGSYIPLDSVEAKQILNKWMPVDLYVGGAEHAAGHLLYARFWHKFLHDIGIVSCSEPFYKLPNRGIILGEDNRKMSKSWGNVIDPLEICESYGADSLRMYEMFMGPLDGTFPWSNSGILGIRKFLDRIWNLFTTKQIDKNSEHDYIVAYNQFIKNVSYNIENLKFNIAVSDMMIFINECYKYEILDKEKMINFLIVISTYCPHIGEELYHYINPVNTSITHLHWPSYDESKLVKSTIKIPVQENGKLRVVIEVDANLSQEKIKEVIMSNEKVIKFINNREIKKFIYVKNKIANIII